MKLIKKLAAAAAVSLAMAGSASAATVLNNWIFNPSGVGGAAAGQVITERLDVTGDAFIQLTATSASTFNFVEHAVFNIVQADGNGQLFPINFAGGNISATFEAYGSGSFSGAFSFGGGTIRMYQNPTNQYSTTAGVYGANLGTMIAEFSVIPGGGGLVDGTGGPITNGQISVFAKATTPGGITPGYFFSPGGADMSGEDVLSFAFTNANGTSLLTPNLIGEVACQFASYTGPGCGTGTYSNVAGSHFFVSNNGQFKLAEVPEPGSLALFGLAILGAGVVSRKRKQA
jgi:hypothetical protein